MIEVERYEKIWIGVALATLVVFLVAIGGSVIGPRIQLPGAAGHVHMGTSGGAQASNAAAFDQPGLRLAGAEAYELYLVAQTWSFTPNEIRVPRNSTITIYATSRDVQHGLMIQGTNVNVMLLPGQITKTTVRFTRPGEYLFMCHEYCGIGHQAMSGKFIVE